MASVTGAGSAGNVGMMKRLSAVMLGMLPLGNVAFAGDGAVLYQTNCSICHEAGAQGRPGQFPPLVGRAAQISATAEGRQYMAAVALNGIMGRITVGGDIYTGFMPSFKMLPDEDIAAILNHVASLPGGDETVLFTPSDIATARTERLSPPAVAEKRKILDVIHPLP